MCFHLLEHIPRNGIVESCNNYMLNRLRIIIIIIISKSFESKLQICSLISKYFIENKPRTFFLITTFQRSNLGNLTLIHYYYLLCSLYLTFTNYVLYDNYFFPDPGCNPGLHKLHLVVTFLQSPPVWNSPQPYFIFLLFPKATLSLDLSNIWMDESPLSIWWAVRSRRRGWTQTLAPSSLGRGEGHALKLKGPSQTWTQGGETAVENSPPGGFTEKCREKERGSVEASSTPFPKNS